MAALLPATTDEWLASVPSMRGPLRDPIGAFAWTDFTVSTTHRTLQCEASDLRLGPMPDPGWLHLVREDQPVLGIAVRGRVGTVWFQLEKIERDAEGDVAIWVLRPVPEHLTLYPALRGWSLHVLND